MGRNETEAVKKPAYRLSKKERKHAATGSPFDRTVELKKQNKPGAHILNTSPVDPSAFSYERVVEKPKTDSFLKKKTGIGSTSDRKKSPNGKENRKPVGPKSKQTAFSIRGNPPNTEFRRFYERGDLPVQVDQNGSLPKLAWKVPIEKLDFAHYLPLFFDGLREVEWPYSFLAERGVKDMINHGSHKVLGVVPQLIIPVKTALNTRDKEVMVRVIRMLQRLVVCDVVADENGEVSGKIGPALVPYYRQILPIFNVFKNQNTNIGDRIDYSQQKEENIGDLINKTLELLELYGGEDAFINLKYLVPTYQSIKQF